MEKSTAQFGFALDLNIFIPVNLKMADGDLDLVYFRLTSG